MLSERLREETFETHVVVEKLIIRRIKNINSANEYCQLLRIFYGYFKPVEEMIEKYITDEMVADIDERRKSKTILDDLEWIGLANQMVVCNDIPPISDPANALGAMYVLEGSTLGGVHISKMIAARLKFKNSRGLSFFNGYGDTSMDRWSFFKEVLNNYTNEHEIGNKVVASANETFTKFRNWIEIN